MDMSLEETLLGQAFLPKEPPSHAAKRYAQSVCMPRPYQTSAAKTLVAVCRNMHHVEMRRRASPIHDRA